MQKNKKYNFQLSQLIDEIYPNEKINNFALDSRDNLAMIQMKEAAKQSGKALNKQLEENKTLAA
mgnify:CR=1 FL=1